MGLFALGFSNNRFVKEKYMLNKEEVEFLKTVVDSLNIKNTEKFIKNIKVMDNYLKKYIHNVIYKNYEGNTSNTELAMLLNIRNKVEKYGVNRGSKIKSISQIKEGEKVTIALPNKYYFKSIMGQKSSDTFVCSYPVDDPNLLEVNFKNLPIKTFYTQKDDALYYFNTEIVSAHEKGIASMFVVKSPKSIYKKQRRSYPRVKVGIMGVSFPVTILGKGKKWTVKIHEDRKAITTIKDISAGGFQITSTGVYEKNEYIKLQFPFNGRDQVILAKVVNSRIDNVNDQRTYHLKTIKQQLDTKLGILLYTYGYNTEKITTDENVSTKDTETTLAAKS